MTTPGACILDADGLRLTSDEKRFFARANPWGFILFARNVDTPDQVAALCSELRDAVGRDALITVDQEGGRVQRFRGPHWRDWPAPLDVVRSTGADAPRALWLMYRIIADELRRVGVDSNCAPTCDVARPETHPFLLNRCLGTRSDEVTAHARAAANGLIDGGVLPVIKHMPGHGRAQADSHKDLPHVDVSAEELLASDFAVFRALNDLPLGMTAHLVFDQLNGQPATVSPSMMALIRNQIGFDGLIMTDDISMKALNTAPEISAARARAAGCDVVLFCNAPLAEREKVAEASGPLDDAGQRRANAALDMRQKPEEVDISALYAEFQMLLNGRGHV